MTAEPTPSPRYTSPMLATRCHDLSRTRAFMSVTRNTPHQRPARCLLSLPRGLGRLVVERGALRYIRLTLELDAVAVGVT